jgi:peroxiredoxin
MAGLSLEGQIAPNFTLKGGDGDNKRLSEYRGRVVMLNFWATWCAPCRQEMPHLNELYLTYENLGFVVLGVNLDEQERRAMSLSDELGVVYPNVFDLSKQVSHLYQVDAMPTTFLIDRDGKIRHVHKGYRPEYIETYQGQVRALLRE